MNFKDIDFGKDGEYRAKVYTIRVKEGNVNITNGTITFCIGGGVEYKKLQKPVNFMEAIESGKLIRCDIRGINKCGSYYDEEEIKKNFNKPSSVCEVSKLFSNLCNGDIKEIITNGKWYIEED